MDKKPNEIHEKLIPTKINNHIIYHIVLTLTHSNKHNIPCNWSAFLAASWLNGGYTCNKIYFINGFVGLHVAILDANIEVIRRPYVKSMTCINMYIQICMCDCVRYKEITFSIKRGVIKKNN